MIREGSGPYFFHCVEEMSRVQCDHLLIDLRQPYDSIDRNELLNWMGYVGFPKS